MDVKIYQTVIQNVFTVYFTVLTEKDTPKFTIPYVDYGRFEVFAEPGFSFKIVQSENELRPYLEKYEKEREIQMMDFSRVGIVLLSSIDHPKTPSLGYISKRLYNDPTTQVSFVPSPVDFVGKPEYSLVREFEINSFNRLDILTSGVHIPEEKFRTITGFLKTLIFRNYLIDTGKLIGEQKIELKWGK